MLTLGGLHGKHAVRSRSYFMTDGQSISMSWCRATLGLETFICEKREFMITTSASISDHFPAESVYYSTVRLVTPLWANK
jgi:hypothetical protein